jgi:hypothetical protein
MIIASLVFASACNTAESSHPFNDGGSNDTDANGPIPTCGEPDRVCPEMLPFTSGPCEGDLHCEAYGDHIADCREGAWVVQPVCDDGPIGGACVPPLVESCDAPFEGMLTDARISVGPFGENRPFAEGELRDVIFGSQGGGMILWSLHTEGSDLPACVRAHVRITLDGGEPYEVAQTMALHCGHSLATFAILPSRPCEFREYAVTLHVAVDGLGETTANVRAAGGRCPR